MINKIGSIGTINIQTGQNNLKQVKKSSNPIYFSGTELSSGAKIASAYQALNGIKTASTVNFKGMSDEQRFYFREFEILIPNIIEQCGNIHIPAGDMETDQEKALNPNGLHFEKKHVNGRDVVRITNDKNEEIFVGKFNMGKNQPTIQYRQGKFDPEITIKDSSMNGESIKMFKGSVIKGEGFELIMPDDDKIKSEISFGGKMVLTTLNKEPRIVESVKMHQSMKPKSFVEDGAYKNVVMQNNPTIVIPAGGFGERIYNISGENENKPSTRLATDERFRVMGTALNLAVASGAYNADGTDDVQYVSQKHVLNNANKNVTHVSEYRTDGGAIAEALERGIIPQGQDIMIFNADVFTNADPTRPYNALKTLPYAGLVIPYYNVAPQKAQPFGLLSVEKDKNDNLKIVDFFEKEKYTVEPQEEDFEDEQKYLEALAKYQRIQGARNPENPDYYLTNPGFYFMTPEVAKVLVDKLNENPDETGLGKHVMPRVVELMEKGELTDKNGNPLRAYTLPLQRKTGEDAVWYDIGKADAFLDLVKDVAKETSEHYNTTENKYYGVPSFIMEDFKDHYDPESGIVFQSEKAMASLSIFKEKYNIDDEDIYGNIYVAE